MSSSNQSLALAHFAGEDAVLPVTLEDANLVVQDEVARRLREKASGPILAKTIRKALAANEPEARICFEDNYIDPNNALYKAIRSKILELNYVRDVYLSQNRSYREGGFQYGSEGCGYYFLHIEFDRPGFVSRLATYWHRKFSGDRERLALPAPGTADKNLEERLLANFGAGSALVAEHAMALNIDASALSDAVSQVQKVIAGQPRSECKRWEKTAMLVLELGKAFEKAHATLPDTHFSQVASDLGKTYQTAVEHIQKRLAEVEQRRGDNAVSQIGVDLAVLQLQLENS